VVLTGDDGAPLLAAGPVGRGRGVVWAAPLDADDSNLGLKPVFVAWARACLALTLPPGAGAEAASARVGRPLVETWAHDRPAPDRVAVRLPGGRRTALEVRDRRAVLPSADAPGLYEFESPDGARMVFAVNLDPATGESDLTPLSSPPWTAVAPQDLDAAFTAAVYGRDRRGWALGLAALALCAEMLLSLPLRRLPALAAAALLLAVLAVPRASAQGDRFVWTQLKLGRGWDPYPGAPDRLTLWLSGVTSARTAPSRRVVALDDPELFFSPFLYLAGTEAPPEPTDAQLRRLRQYLAGGGFLWIEDAAGGPPGSFDAWVRAVLPRVLPGATLEPLPPDHVIYRTFFLLRGPAGCAPARGALEGVLWDGRAAVVYTRDDVLGAWALDALGRPLKNCPDREDARRLSLNLLMYSLTGSYKADAVHQAAILEKLKEAP
jgi:hypothetical protein